MTPIRALGLATAALAASWPLAAAVADEPCSSAGTVVVVSSSLPLRATPEARAGAIIARASRGRRLECAGPAPAGWVRVRLRDGRTAFGLSSQVRAIPGGTLRPRASYPIGDLLVAAVLVALTFAAAWRASNSYLAAVLLVGLLSPGFLAAFLRAGKALAQVPSWTWPVAGGCVLGWIAERFIARRLPVIETFEHELTHALAALLCLRRISGFVVTRREGGFVQHAGGFGGALADHFIGLAPYIVPTFTVALVAVRPLVPDPLFPWFDVAVGLTLGYHTPSTYRELRGSWTREQFRMAGSGELVQSDIGRRGYVFASVFIAGLSMAVHGLLLAVLAHGYRGGVLWCDDVWLATRSLADGLAAAVMRLVNAVH